MKRVLILIIILVMSTVARAGMLNPDVLNTPGTRGAAMAGAFSAVADDYSAVFWNPAGIVLCENISVGGSFDRVYSGSRNNFFWGVVVPTDDAMSFALSYGHTEFNPKHFDIDTLYISLAAYPREETNLATGLTFKITGISGREWGVNASAFLIDAGLIYTPEFLERKTRFSFTVHDFDGYMEWNTGEKNRLPTTYSFGSVYFFDNTGLAAFDAGIKEKGYGQHTASVSLGAEKYFNHPQFGNFGIRAGINYDHAYEPGFYGAFGMGYKKDFMSVDYAYGPDFRKFGETHKISAVFVIGPQIKIKDIIKNVPVRKKEKPLTDAKSPDYPEIKFTASSKYLNQQKPVTFIIENQPAAVVSAVTKIQIIDSAGKAVRTITHTGRIPRELSWDSLDDKALPVKDGDYDAVLTITEGEKLLWKKAKVITVDTSAPACSISVWPKKFAASPASLVKNAVITIEPQPYDTSKWELNLFDLKGNVIRKFSGEGAPGKIYFNGKDAMNEYLKDGDYVFVFDIEDFAGNKYRSKENIRITSETVKFKVSVENRIFTPGVNPVAIGPVFNDVTDAALWNLQIEDLNGDLIKEFKNKVPGTAPVSWDGTDENNQYVSEGSLYRYKIIVIQKSGMQSFAEGYIQSTLPEFKSTGINLILAAVKFPKNEKSIPVEEYNSLSQAAAAIKQYAKDYIVFIKSYSSDTGDSAANFNLSVERALQVLEYLADGKDIPRSRIKIYAVGDGVFAPGASAQQEAAEKGARVEVELLSR